MSKIKILIVSLLILAACKPSKGPSNEQDQSVKDQSASKYSDMLGLPELPVPKNNPITKEKVALGDRLYHDSTFSATGKVSCATCHAQSKGFTDQLPVSQGINGLKGTRNAPTVINAAYNTSQFWDGRSPDLEDQALHPFVNPVEMGLKDHKPIIEKIKNDDAYVAAFKDVFDIPAEEITIEHVTMAIAAFQRTIIGGNSRFDRWYFKDEKSLSEKEQKGFEVFTGNGRCVSCHLVEQTTALFTDSKFHNVGVGINNISESDVQKLAAEYLKADYNQTEVDMKALQDAKSSELGRFAVTRNMTEMGAFKTPTLRNIELTAPYMHDGNLNTLEEVVEHYNRGGASTDEEKINPYLSGGIRPLDLTDTEKEDLVAFLKTLTSEKFKK